MNEFRLPQIGEGVYEAELLAWLVKVGDTVKRGQGLMEVLTDKATMEVPAPFTGTIFSLDAQPGQAIKVGQNVLTYADSAESPKSSASKTSEKPVAALPSVTEMAPAPTRPQPIRNGLTDERHKKVLIKAAPSVRLMARKLGVDLARIPGSGPNGRVLLEDVTKSTPIAPAPRAASSSFGQPGSRVKLQGLRRKIADHMILATKTIPHYAYVDECNVTELVRLRETLRDPYAKVNAKLTYLSFIVKAISQALKEVPLVNSSLDESAGEIVLHDHYHVGIAVATPNGLIVPIIRDADHKDLIQISREIERLSGEARAGKIRLEDLRGGTFTVTSIGGIGGLISTPVINHPEVGILGIGKVVKRPIYDEQMNLIPADMLYLSFSFDHRVLDGAVGAAFSNAVIRRLQQPALLMLPEDMANIA